jgi:hypothetical protein
MRVRVLTVRVSQGVHFDFSLCVCRVTAAVVRARSSFHTET